MSRRTRSRATRAARALRNKARVPLLVASASTLASGTSPRPFERMYSARGGVSFVVRTLPVRLPFDPNAAGPPAGLASAAVDALLGAALSTVAASSDDGRS